MCACVRPSVRDHRPILKFCEHDIVQIYSLVGDKDKLIRFSGQKAKDHQETKYGQKSPVKNAHFPAKAYRSPVHHQRPSSFCVDVFVSIG